MSSIVNSAKLGYKQVFYYEKKIKKKLKALSTFCIMKIQFFFNYPEGT